MKMGASFVFECINDVGLCCLDSYRNINVSISRSMGGAKKIGCNIEAQYTM
jgi:hypothetical protein